MKFTKAPVSEVILGINFATNVIPNETLIRVIAALQPDFPSMEMLPPLVLEEMKEFRFESNIDPSLSGPVLYRLRSLDKKWLVQIQGDKIYLNWIRLDVEPVGNYIGFSAIKMKFDALLAIIQKIVKVDLYEKISTLDLSYHDRLEWQEFISDLSKVNEILNIQSPPKLSTLGYNNIFSKYTFHDPEMSGYGFLNISTGTSIENKQLLKVEVNLRGKCESTEVDTWFTNAHIKHLSIFERIFTESVKEKWK